MPNNNLDTSLVKFIINKYYTGYLPQHYDDLYSYGLKALYEADAVYDPQKTNKPFKYFATCLIRRAMFGYVRDKIPKIQYDITYTDNTTFLEQQEITNPIKDDYLDLYNVLKKLNNDEKTLIYNIYYLDKTIVDTAKIVKISPSSCAKRLEKLLEKIKEKLSMNHKDALYLAIKYIMDMDDISLNGVARIIEVSNERLKEFMSKYEQN